MVTQSFVRAALAGLLFMGSPAFMGNSAFVQNSVEADEADYYRIVPIVSSSTNIESRSPNWKPSDKVAMEVGGIVALDDQRVAVAIRKGEVWLLEGVYEEPANRVIQRRFASGLHEPLGLLKRGDSLLTAQRTEVTALTDLDGDQVADRYETVANDWGLTGNYHEYAFGPERDGKGNLWLTLNLGLGLTPEQRERTLTDAALGVRQAKWRGWALKIDSDGNVIPVCAGLRSPAGLGANADGDMFATDQQGNWIPTNALHHLRPGAFFLHPESLASMNQPGVTVPPISKIAAGLPYPQALEKMPAMRPPAVWFPYKKAGQSTTDVLLDDSRGAFGPFSGQLFVGEFTLASIHRVFLEKVDGEYQGAVFPFRSGFASAVLRLAQGTDGSLFAGLTNRGWSSLGTAAYGLERLVWTGKMPFEIQEMRAKPDGFELVFTQPVDPVSAGNVASYQFQSYTYRYHESYGSDEILRQDLTITGVDVSADRTRVELKLDSMRPSFVHELDASGVRNEDGRPLLHKNAYYTLNRIPTR